MRDHQSLMNEVYDYWQQNKTSREEALDNFSELHKAAVQLGNLNYQVENGGFSQWHFNEYSDDLPDLLKLCNKGIALNIKGFKLLKSLLIIFEDLPNPNKTEIETSTCHNCSGEGTILDYDLEDNEIEVECNECCGSGEIEEEYDNWQYFGNECHKLDVKYYEYENWLNDYQELLNRFDEKVKEVTQTIIEVRKPKCKLTGVDGNIFTLVGVARDALGKAKMKNEAKEMSDKVSKAKSYDEALCIIADYVDVY